MKKILLLICMAGTLLGADEASLIVRPIFSLAFHAHVHGDKGSEQRIIDLNDQTKPLPSNFSCGLSGTIHSEGMRMGGGHFGLKGTYYDSESNSILNVGGGIILSEEKFSFQGFPPGDYSLFLTVNGKNVYSDRIRLPLTPKEAAAFHVTVPKIAEISGVVEDVPVWALESPLVGCGPGFAQVDKLGHFNIKTQARADEKIEVIFRFLNKFIKDWDVAIYHYKFIFPQEIPGGKLRIPMVGSWKSVEGKVSFEGGLPGQALAPVLQNLSILAISADGGIVYECPPDTQGRFFLIGLPDGDYTVHVDPFGNPPFTSDPVSVSIVDQKAPGIEFILRAIK